ncbi:DUF2256 domain-containing protein [Pedobacter sp. MC2016-05]|uniref:DUF2256 domain-containing protein n=1 Tax=Pedobacter sp. MC2016-05 TaxID=2994474 RepID=UPI002246CEED|nr:DUF2256 domain-containing protein [Pedobacter sp. MC2016-05]MCX2475836.1 DUF2256 domain-containing protein [Pedobacter sp. MC2016-05]
MKKENLPEKTCPTCERPFSWRKKWKLNWDNVIYCSLKCKTHKKNRDTEER